MKLKLRNKNLLVNYIFYQFLKVNKVAPVSKPVVVQADSKPKENITLAKAEPQKPANLKELAKQEAKDKNPVAKTNPAKPATATVVEKAQVQPKATVTQKPTNVATEQAKPAKGGKTVVIKSQPEILPEKSKPVIAEQGKKVDSTEANLNKK